MTGQEILPPVSAEVGEVWDAARVVGSVVVTCQAANMLVPGSWRGIVGRHAKSLLEEGFPGDMIVAASILAIKRGKPQLLQYIAGDLMLASSGFAMSRSEYETKLQLYAQSQSQQHDLLAEQKERISQRSAEIERMRSGGRG